MGSLNLKLVYSGKGRPGTWTVFCNISLDIRALEKRPHRKKWYIEVYFRWTHQPVIVTTRDNIGWGSS